MKIIHVVLASTLLASPAFAAGGKAQQSSMDQSSGSQQSQVQQMQSNPDHVKQIQQKLSDQGYDLQIDGQWGPRTQQALQQFQQENGIQGNGQLNQQTLAELGVEPDSQTAQTPEDSEQQGSGGSLMERQDSGGGSEQQSSPSTSQ